MELTLYQVIGQRIKDQRERMKWTQVMIADKVQMTRASITNIESGRQKISLDTLYNIANAFEMDVYSLLPANREESTSKSMSDIILKTDTARFSDEEVHVIKQAILNAMNKKGDLWTG